MAVIGRRAQSGSQQEGIPDAVTFPRKMPRAHFPGLGLYVVDRDSHPWIAICSITAGHIYRQLSRSKPHPHGVNFPSSHLHANNWNCPHSPGTDDPYPVSLFLTSFTDLYIQPAANCRMRRWVEASIPCPPQFDLGSARKRLQDVGLAGHARSSAMRPSRAVVNVMKRDLAVRDTLPACSGSHRPQASEAFARWTQRRVP